MNGLMSKAMKAEHDSLSTMTPLERYRQDLTRPYFYPDAAQEQVVYRTQQLYEALLASRSKLARLRDKFWAHKQAPITGIYLYGRVGSGKTYLMDNFYRSLPGHYQLRLHFHHWMQRIHQHLRQLSATADPLTVVAKQLAQQAPVICLDEFYVADITDAMLLARLLAALFSQQVTLVTTSNVEPDALYQGGLQRQRFLPAIALIKQHMDIICLDEGIDYRLRGLATESYYYYPITEATAQQLSRHFEHLTLSTTTESTVLTIQGRSLPTVRCVEGVVWFHFQQLCDTPRSVSDYIELAQHFNTIFLTDIPPLDDNNPDAVLRFIQLIDECYDRRVKVIFSAAMPAQQLYSGSKHAAQFQRTASRLIEMGSKTYWQQAHQIIPN